MTTGTERRAHPRVRADLPIQLTAEGGAADASIRDISLSGVCCITDRAMPVMTQVRLTIVLP
ncbi:MAG TPA: PilZ domain-containing protein, partial [Polyangiaceae bacterium]|nr:PilZ domain-containing protein [Polyangiaceae bacterium]